jgi:uncharacterized membrane protein
MSTRTVFQTLADRGVNGIASVEVEPTPTRALPPETSSARMEAIDVLRGAVMVLMALDHARGFFVSTSLDPTDLSRSNAVLFLTRWVTHFCAPVFCLLAGAGAFLSTFRGKTRPQLARYLLSRGLWLVVLEWTVIQFCWHFGWDGRPFRCQVLWAIGCSMALLASMILLPPWAVLASGVALIAGNHWLESLLASQMTTAPWVRVVLTSGGSFGLTPGFQFVVSYPILPWFGVMAVG